ncbi:hypothetical protein [Aquabacterium sp.]|nr:hypothetical protein [Aquabacterium sp.]HEX5312383.1 hypothetical protein [Aquabacterium sp.]
MVITVLGRILIIPMRADGVAVMVMRFKKLVRRLHVDNMVALRVQGHGF